MAEQSLWSGKLDANAEPGVKTGLTLNTRDPKITITVTGSAKYAQDKSDFGPAGDPSYQNPNTLLPSANVGAVLMKVGNGPYRVVGNGLPDWTIREDGELTFFYNDWPGKYGDNSGSFDINVVREIPVLWSGTLQATAEQGVQSGVTVSHGDVISITATGAASLGPGLGTYGPDGWPNYKKPEQIMPSANCGAVLMTIGGGPYILVGSGLSDYTVQGSGEITFFCNDAPGHFYDNTGSFEITITK